MASNLLTGNHWWIAQAAKWQLAGHRDPADLRVRVANRMTRAIFQIVAGRQRFRHRAQCQPSSVMDKLLLFCRTRHMAPAEIVTHLKQASQQMRDADRRTEAALLKPVALKHQRSRRQEPQELGTLLVALLARLGIASNPQPEKNST
jgi:hypothetical protein